ncbi:lipocalin family protein [Aquabacterium sp. A7-Y]|uniref:lipocalin family protein n=1 Tax=Aquabacterium sp. A7-Y TaxID=1349605 RepID=UPI00223D741A|nr:lipocalin family protein [Aquabacterium sp. A7-Y]MCW7536304.1 lipocalin family protein [Aquabacterium sp. A7-Y]
MLRSLLTQIDARIEQSEAQVRLQDARTFASWQQAQRAGKQRVKALAIGGATTLVTGWLWRRLTRGKGGGKRERRRSSWTRTLFGPAVVPLLASLATPLLGRKGSAFLAGLGLPFAQPELVALGTAAQLSLDQYCGVWYEIAALPPARTEELGASDVVTVFEPLPDGGLKVTTECLRGDGSVRREEGTARIPDPEHPSRLELSFAPAWLRWWPGSWTDYWVLHVESDYSAALVGTPERDGLWLLSRTPTLDAGTFDDFVRLAQQEGFDVKRLIRTAHTSAAGTDPTQPRAATTAPLAPGESDRPTTYH